MPPLNGFPGQRFRVLPAPLTAKALRTGLTSRLLVTDAGYFPRARGHGMTRPEGAPTSIVIICQDGAGQLWYGERSYRVEAGDAVVIPSDEPHRYRSDDERPWTIGWFHADGLDVPELTQAALGPARVPVAPLRDVYTAWHLVDRVIAALERDETEASLLAAAGAAWNVFAQIASERRLGPAGTIERVNIAQDYLRKNLAAAPSVSELARLAGLSTSHFAAVFRRSAGMGVLEYIKRLRNSRARELLIATSMPIAEVGRSVGYSDPFYFSRQFHSINGTSPSDFRAQYRQHTERSGFDRPTGVDGGAHTP
ncbi:AraC family transcriptional regulator [Rugosimonospora africana]|uniref:AraC family transcriptional regulator n=1 Tax=Rugosimonospora africana TaxID=556532 RepID=A0A8J3QU56_9ACTN|nr:AraC family transcriptional regulator [Rugosimonospora africana]GIH15845.1 AraC family transcriptional regulator [Rugosimonospora africana]